MGELSKDDVLRIRYVARGNSKVSMAWVEKYLKDTEAKLYPKKKRTPKGQERDS